MPSTEVQRTLVKSPPELWAELSDPASLARHLRALGEIQLTRVEPESAVEWEAENVKGSVQLKASGWGTKVTFSLTRELPESAAPAPVVGDAVPSERASVVGDAVPSEPEPGQVNAEPEPLAAEPEPPLAEPELVEPETTPEQERIPRRSFFARLFRRRRKETLASTPGPAADLAEPEISEPVAEIPEEELPQAPTPAATLESATDTTLQPAAPMVQEHPDLAAELALMEQAMVEQDTALLTAVLDRLGAAHHRPFSRG